MDEYLNKGIKEIIAEFPEVENILNDYDIGCGPCNVGICLLKDIVAIHRLSDEQEQHLMNRITGVIRPEKEIRIPRSEKKSKAESKEFKYSRELLTEHIRKEDEILYPWMDSQLSSRQMDELFSKFDEADRQFDVSSDRYEDFIDQLEKKFERQKE